MVKSDRGLYQVSPNGKTILQYPDWETDIDTTRHSYSDSPSLCVCGLHLVLHDFIRCVRSCFHCHSQDTEFHHKGSSCCPFITTSTVLQHHPFLSPSNHSSILRFWNSVFSKRLFKWKNAVHNLLRMAVYRPAYFPEDSSKLLHVFIRSFSWLCSIPW